MLGSDSSVLMFSIFLTIFTFLVITKPFFSQKLSIIPQIVDI